MSQSNSSVSPIISVSGLRGIVGQSLTPQTAVAYTAAYATWVLQHAQGNDPPKSLSPRPRVIVARDGRDSGAMLTDAIVCSLNACGIDALLADIAATPTVGVLVQANGAAGAIQVSASHNPPPYNGMKLFGSDGRVIPARWGSQVLQIYQSQNFAWQNHSALGNKHRLPDTTAVHLEKVLATVQVAKIRQRKFRVVLDSNHASGSLLGRSLLDALGCEYTIVGDTPDGNFAHPPEPTRANLQSVTQLAQQHRAEVVFCQDPDADRLAIIDQHGNYIGEEYTLALTLQHALSQHAGPVVTNCSSSRMTMDLAKQFGVPCFLSKVGEANVTDLMIEKKAVYGGEGSGGPIDPRVGYVRDSFVGIAQVLDAMASTGKSISQLVDALPKYEIQKMAVPLPATTDSKVAVQQAFARLEAHFSDAKISHQDGLRIDWDDAWLLVRPSNTEPIVRAVAEATTTARATQLCTTAATIVAAG